MQVDANIAKANALIISGECFLYGGLINSRISNDSTATVAARLNKLVGYKASYPSLKIYLSSVVMRIPAYNGYARVRLCASTGRSTRARLAFDRAVCFDQGL